MIDDLLLIAQPEDDDIVSVKEYYLRGDGSVRLTLAVAGPLPDSAAIVLAGVGGLITDLGDDGATVGWDWPAGMRPEDPVQTCTRHVEAAISAWAIKWAPGNAIDLR